LTPWLRSSRKNSKSVATLTDREDAIFAAMNKTVIRAGLNLIYLSGAHYLLQSFFGGIGAILALHHVRPRRPDPFQPNQMLEVSPSFLEEVIIRVRRSGFDIISLDEMHRRLIEGELRQRFVCLTFDDGYRDNLIWAYPILKKHQAPFAIFIATSFTDRLGDLWWLTLETVIARNSRIDLNIDGMDRQFVCERVEDKRRVFDVIYPWLHSLDNEAEHRRVIEDLARRYAVDISAFCRELCMSWDEIGSLAADTLVTIGAHTVNHRKLKKLEEAVARTEMQASAAQIEAALGVRPCHFAYPYGNRAEAGTREFRIAGELGFKTAVTTRPGVLFTEHRNYLTALPRIVLDGEFQRLRCVDVLLSGAPRALWTGFRRIDTA